MGSDRKTDFKARHARIVGWALPTKTVSISKTQTWALPTNTAMVFKNAGRKNRRFFLPSPQNQQRQHEQKKPSGERYYHWRGLLGTRRRVEQLPIVAPEFRKPDERNRPQSHEQKLEISVIQIHSENIDQSRDFCRCEAPIAAGPVRIDNQYTDEQRK